MEERTKRKLNKKAAVQVLCLLVLIILAVGGIVKVRNLQVQEYQGYEMKSEAGLYANLSGYLPGKDRIFVYSNDGARAVNHTGESLWEISYQLDHPEVAYCENVAAVADVGGRSVYVVAENGIPHNYEVIYPIVKHEVARQGVTAVLLDNGLEDYIQLYDMDGTLRVDINTQTKVDGIPIDIALSQDGKKLVTLYVTFQGDAMLCKTTFYNADEVGKNYINNIVGQKTFAENQLAYDVCFLDENTLCILLENGFSLYRMTEVPELVAEVLLEESIEEMVCVENGLYVVKETEDKQKVLSFYDTKGKEKTILKEVPEHEFMAAAKEEIVFFSPQKVSIYRANGSRKFTTSFAESMEAVFPAGNNQYFLIAAGTLQTIKLSNHIKNEEQKEN